MAFKVKELFTSLSGALLICSILLFSEMHPRRGVGERHTSASAVLMSARVFLFISGRVRARRHDQEIDLFIKKPA